MSRPYNRVALLFQERQTYFEAASGDDVYAVPEDRCCGEERILPHTGELCPDPGDLIGEKTIYTNKERDDRKQHAW